MIDIINLIIQSIIAVCAFFALKQLKLSKTSFQLNSKRESIRYASELVHIYLNEIIPKINHSNQDLKTLSITSYKGELDLKDFTLDEIKNNDKKAQEHFFMCLNATHKKSQENVSHHSKNLAVMNSLESFAAPFIAGVADEEIAFTAIGKTFCDSVVKIYYEYCSVRRNENKGYNYFENTIKLYNTWSERIKKHKLKNQEDVIHNALKNINDNPIQVLGSKI